MKAKLRNSYRGGVLIALAMVVCAAGTARADLLVTGQGESLSGDLTRIVDGIIVFRTSLAGQMMMPVAEAASLTTDGGWVVTDQEGEVFIGRFVPGGVETKPGGEGTAPEVAPLALDTVDSARQLPSAMESSGKEARPGGGLSGYAGVGVRAFAGSADGVEPHMRLGLRGGNARGEIDMRVGVDVGDTDSFPEYVSGEFEVAGHAEASWAPFVHALIERDRNRSLSFRSDLRIGVRYDFDASPGASLAGLAGLGVSYGRWDRNDLVPPIRWPGGDERTETDLNLHLELRYSRALWGRATWDSRIYVLPNLTEVDDLRAGASTALVYPLSTRLQLRLDMLMGYDQDPIFDSLDTVDTSLGASIQLDF